MENKGIFGKTYKASRREKGIEKTIEITAQAPYRFISLPKEIFIRILVVLKERIFALINLLVKIQKVGL